MSTSVNVEPTASLNNMRHTFQVDEIQPVQSIRLTTGRHVATGIEMLPRAAL
jgi:hypothetical protein